MNDTELSAFQDDESDQQDWNLEVLQALICPSSGEDAALACAAAWMNYAGADRVAVVVFDSTSTCIVAHGQRDNQTHIAIYVGRTTTSISGLLRPETLCSATGPCTIEDPTDIYCWPEHLSAVMVRTGPAEAGDFRRTLVQNLSRRLLSRWTTQDSSFANPDHMAAMAEFAAGAGHEINNPLGSIIGQTQLVLKRSDRADVRQALETIGAQAWRIRDMIGDTMLFARPPQPEFGYCDLKQLATSAAEALRDECQSRKCSVRVELPDSDIIVFADAAQLNILLTNLIRNACQATDEAEVDGDVRIIVRRDREFAVSVEVRDNGPELPTEIRRHMFNPFFSGRQAGRGLGFGLCHCWQITRMHNAILMHEPLSRGNRFVVVLPAEPSQNRG